jgi:CHAT domain-containing protein
VNLGMGDLIADLDLPRCEIVANLACESAFPSVRRVPGLDFSTVFIAAGARSVLGSTWVVRDDVASAFCRLFFEAWASGAKSSVAFQQALDRLRRSQPALPAFDWAGLRLVGGP